MHGAPKNQRASKEENMNQNEHAQSTSSLITMVTNLAVGMPNEEFGLLSRWMTSEANRRRERVAVNLKKGDEIVFINYSDKLTRGVVQKLGTKNALIKTENGGRMYVPLARLERVSDSTLASQGALAVIPSLSSLPSVSPPPVAPSRPSQVTTVAPKAAKGALKASARPSRKPPKLSCGGSRWLG